MLWLFLCIHLLNLAFDDGLIFWFIQHDPDASILHFHMIRSILLTIVMIISTRFRTNTTCHMSWRLLIPWSLFGFILPHITYSFALQHIRIDILQPLIPFLTYETLNDRQTSALLVLFGCSLYSVYTLEFDQPIVFVLVGYVASALHVCSLVLWYRMLKPRDMFMEMVWGQSVAALVFALIWFDESTLSLHVFEAPLYEWMVYLLLSCVVVVLRYVMINRFAGDPIISVFDSLHPIVSYIYHQRYMNAYHVLGILFGCFVFVFKDWRYCTRCIIQERCGSLPCWSPTFQHAS